jgi:uncharacterized protein YprB with RNaseH-like and TPR domain
LRAWSGRGFRGAKAEAFQRALDDSESAWDRRDLHFFYQILPRPELWRLVPGFFDEIAFLDIETNGLNLPPYSQSTTITFYFRGRLYQEYEHRRKRELIESMQAEASIFCTYFGEVFDVPFLRREFKLSIEKAHLDLCFWLKRQGYNGGLKKVERCFDDIPKRKSMDIDGFDAVRLWHYFQKGDRGALDTLLTYNAEDTIVLQALLVKAFNFEVESRPYLGLKPLAQVPPPPMPTSVDPRIYDRLRGRA